MQPPWTHHDYAVWKAALAHEAKHGTEKRFDHWLRAETDTHAHTYVRIKNYLYNLWAAFIERGEKQGSMPLAEAWSWRARLLAQREVLKLHMLRHLEWFFRLTHVSAIMQNYLWQAVLEIPERVGEPLARVKPSISTLIALDLQTEPTAKQESSFMKYYLGLQAKDLTVLGQITAIIENTTEAVQNGVIESEEPPAAESEAEEREEEPEEEEQKET